MQSRIIISISATDQTVNSMFPNMSGTVWMWFYDGKHPSGLLEFLGDGKIKYRLGKRQGGWTIRDGGLTLVVNFNGEEHILSFFSEEEKAIPLSSWIRNPRRLMFLLKGMLRHFIICITNVCKLCHRCIKK